MAHLSGKITEGPPPISSSSCEEHSAVMMAGTSETEQGVLISSIMTGCTLSALEPGLSDISSSRLRQKAARLLVHWFPRIPSRLGGQRSVKMPMSLEPDKDLLVHALKKSAAFLEKVKSEAEYSRMTLKSSWNLQCWQDGCLLRWGIIAW